MLPEYLSAAWAAVPAAFVMTGALGRLSGAGRALVSRVPAPDRAWLRSVPPNFAQRCARPESYNGRVSFQ
jgi:hypothetical protein